METNSEKLSAQQSLDIIADMIDQAKGSVQQNSFYFLLWGWTILIANLGMFSLIKLHYEYPYAIWLITIPPWLYSLYQGYNRDGSAKSVTHLGKITVWLWLSFGIVIFTLVVFGYQINFHLNPVILVVSAMPTLLSGIVIKFKPLIVGGIVFWVMGIICFMVPTDIQYLVGALAILGGYIIPGYMLKTKQA
ncbi:MAG: hypothetical protein JNM57_05405 [Cyclobacteriaceae bacterium]|nr:hypothetical protein [Cyclobacteriaceae bacterium]